MTRRACLCACLVQRTCLQRCHVVIAFLDGTSACYASDHRRSRVKLHQVFSCMEFVAAASIAKLLNCVKFARSVHRISQFELMCASTMLAAAARRRCNQCTYMTTKFNIWQHKQLKRRLFRCQSMDAQKIVQCTNSDNYNRYKDLFPTYDQLPQPTVGQRTSKRQSFIWRIRTNEMCIKRSNKWI
jgi:hypothetical protein